MNSNPVLFLTSVAHQFQTTRLHRDLDKMKSEQSEAVADLMTAREQEKIADMLSGQHGRHFRRIGPHARNT